MQCPKCGHVRATDTEAPTWQYPACGIAYNKYSTYLAQARTRLQPLPADAKAPPIGADTSVWALITANIAALVIAIWQGWTLSELMLLYWGQSVIIGASYVARILSLEKFSTKNFRINKRAVEPTSQTKRQTAFFFVIHFGAFHLFYIGFILKDAPVTTAFDIGLLVCTLAFAANHWFSYQYHRDLDRQGTPNIGTLMFTPYLRIIPMHLTIILGATLGGGAGLIVFGILKTIADAIMHVIEHKRLGHKE